MKYTAITCNQAKRMLGSAPRHYGYTLKIDPPLVHTVAGHDYEGIGWVPCTPQTVIQRWQGWYMHKATAIQRAKELSL